MNASERISAILSHYGISVNDFARRLGFARPQAIYDILSGKTKSITEKMALKIISVFSDIDKSWLLSGEGRMLKGAYGRINEILEKEGITQKEFAKGSGEILPYALPSIYKNAQKNPGDPKVLGQWVRALKDRFPQYSEKWIMTGEGDMLDILEDANENNTFALRANREPNSQIIPLYDYEAAAGLVAIFNEHAPEPVDFLKIPNLPAVDGALYVRGESMYPLLKSGDIVMYKKKELSVDSILWGEIYLLSFDSDGDTYTSVKYIRKSDKEGMIRLVSFNENFAPKDIPISSIKALALVKASLSFHTME